MWGEKTKLLDHVLMLITLLADLAKPSKEQLALQMELQRLQNARRLDEEEFDNQKQVLQAQLQSEVSHIMAAEVEKRCGHFYIYTFSSDSIFPYSVSSVCDIWFLVTCTAMSFMKYWLFHLAAGAAVLSAQH